MKKQIYSQTYCGEDLYDVERDVSEAFDALFNPAVKDIPVDDGNLQTGVFTITITWEGDDEQ